MCDEEYEGKKIVYLFFYVKVKSKIRSVKKLLD